MAVQPIPLVPADKPANAGEKSAPQPSRPRMSTRNRLIFFLTAWLVVLMPFLFWWSTWFGRALTDKEMNEYLNDNSHPRHIQHSIVQLGQRMSRHDPSAARWYADLVRLASNPREEVRSTDAWVMGQDTTGPGFHEALLKMLNDPSLIVCGNAALSLVSFGDSSGRPQIVSLLQPVAITAPTAGRVMDTAVVGTAIHQGGLIAKLRDSDGDGQQTRELRSPITGHVRTLSTATGASVVPGTTIATVEPGEEQVWEALRALYLIGQLEDLPSIRPYERELPEVPERLRRQAIETDRAIQERARASK
ncbi:Biotin/lipoyl attachment domain-containing protein [Acidobacteriia bacterium SbA2]|nr:Biotin/lipoyl attachment domain-containing protein [Acidobacteriia bacterium SbA2]